MVDVNKNGIPDDEETRAYKSRAVNAKFSQQLSYGLGASMVFGLVGALAKSLLDVAVVNGSIAIAPVLGLVGLGIMGVGLLYLSAKFLSENTVADQELQAKQISAATRGKAPATAVEPIKEKPVEFPAQGFSSDKATPDVPQTIISGDKILSSMERIRATRAANENKPDASWQEKTAAASTNEEKVRA